MDHEGQTQAGQPSRVEMFFQGGLRIKISGWRGWVWAVGGLYFWFWLTAALTGAIPRGAFVPTLVVAVVAGMGWALVLFGPAPVAAPLASPARARDLPTERSWTLVVFCLAVAAVGMLIKIFVVNAGGILAVAGLAGVWGHLWESSRWKLRSDELGSHKAATREMWDELRGRGAG